MDETHSVTDTLEEIGHVRLYVATLVAGVFALVAGALAFPQRVYDEFIWQYFWGPIVADAHGVFCVERVGGQTNFSCSTPGAVTAEPGYTLLSTISYAVVLVFALLGVIILLNRLRIELDRPTFFALFPFVLFGGALRVVEDANVALLRTGADTVIPFPWTALIISPIIYFFVFAIVLVTLIAGAYAQRRGLIDHYANALAATGVAVLLGTLLTLSFLAATTDVLGFYPSILVITLGGATLLTGIVWVLTERYTPSVNEATGAMGAVIVWGHTVDGVANVLSLDWADALGLPVSYGSKHVANQAIRDITASVQPAEVSAAIGTTWPFLFVKIGVAVLVVWIFNDEAFEDSPRYTMMILIAVLAVGLGPGTRDMLRAAFGI